MKQTSLLHQHWERIDQWEALLAPMANNERETALWAVDRDCNGTHLPCQMILLTPDSTSTTSPFEIRRWKTSRRQIRSKMIINNTTSARAVTTPEGECTECLALKLQQGKPGMNGSYQLLLFCSFLRIQEAYFSFLSSFLSIACSIQ